MKLVNGTDQDTFYSISCTNPNSGDCGTIKANGSTELDYYDNKTDVKVRYNAEPAGKTPYKVTIPQSGTGKAVTIRMVFQ